MEEKNRSRFIGYEYKELVAAAEHAPFYADCYAAFGWEQDENFPAGAGSHTVTLRFKRDRKIINKAELTRLQRNFEACIREIEQLERSKTSAATVIALVVGILGTAFMAGSVFAVTHEPPIIWLCILLAVPAFVGWILPYFLYRSRQEKQTRKVQPLIEETLDEIYELCEKGHALLYD